jgi:hypothetical protein
VGKEERAAFWAAHDAERASQGKGRLTIAEVRAERAKRAKHGAQRAGYSQAPGRSVGLHAELDQHAPLPQPGAIAICTGPG